MKYNLGHGVVFLGHGVQMAELGAVLVILDINLLVGVLVEGLEGTKNLVCGGPRTKNVPRRPDHHLHE